MNSPRQPRNLAASIRQRLLNMSKQRHEDFQLLLTRYGIERTIYRLSLSKYCKAFILKGATLFTLWSDNPHRATRDLDLLGRGPSDIAHLEHIFREIIATKVEEDGLVFLLESVKGERIKQDQEYQGVRIHFQARLEAAQILIQVDIGFGDTITPSPKEVEYPTLLDFPKPQLLAYPRETVIAEKFQAMVALGIANSRMKDFYDIWILASKFDFQGEVLAQAIKATFSRRQTPLPTELPLALTPDFYQEKSKQTQWEVFIRRNGLQMQGGSFTDVIILLQNFLMPPTYEAIQSGHFNMIWLPSGPWQAE
ncbi:MAG: nucleotidyl transferase AbiEii/AbiGii toxin family protein [Acidobacteriota bacterium]